MSQPLVEPIILELSILPAFLPTPDSQPAEVDSCIMALPDDLAGASLLDLGRMIDPIVARTVHEQAARMGEILHHADVVVTRSPAVIKARGSLHDCEECAAGVRSALRALREQPDARIVVATLYWQEQP